MKAGISVTVFLCRWRKLHIKIPAKWLIPVGHIWSTTWVMTEILKYLFGITLFVFNLFLNDYLLLANVSSVFRALKLNTSFIFKKPPIKPHHRETQFVLEKNTHRFMSRKSQIATELSKRWVTTVPNSSRAGTYYFVWQRNHSKYS